MVEIIACVIYVVTSI